MDGSVQVSDGEQINLVICMYNVYFIYLFIYLFIYFFLFIHLFITSQTCYVIIAYVNLLTFTSVLSV